MAIDNTSLAALKHSRELFITPDEAAKVIGCNPNVIRIQTHDDPTKLGFPVCVVKSRTKIPRVPFIEFIEGTNEKRILITITFESSENKISLKCDDV